VFESPCPDDRSEETISTNQQKLDMPPKLGFFTFYWRIVVRPYLGRSALIGSLMVLSATFEMATVSLAVPFMNVLGNSDGDSDSRVVSSVSGVLVAIGLPSDSGTAIFTILCLAMALFALGSGVRFAHEYMTAGIAYRLNRETRSALFEKLLRARYEVLTARGRGAILHAINVPSDAIFSAITQLGKLLTALLNATMLFGLMLYLSWWATMLVGVFVVIGVRGLRRLLDRRSEEYGGQVYALQEERTKLEVDSFDGAKVVKIHALEDRMISRHRELLSGEEGPILRLALFRFSPRLLNEVAASFIVIFLGGLTFLAPTVGMSIPVLVAFLVAIRTASPAVANVNSLIVELSACRRKVEVIDEVLSSTPTEDVTPVVDGSTAVAGEVNEIEMKAVSFAYRSRPESRALQDVSLTMKKGTLTAIVGSTGSGKSTIASLMVRFYDPSAGEILVDGVDLRTLNLVEWRNRIGYVSQDVFLFNATVADNMSLWNESVSRRDVERVAATAQISDFIETLPEGYDTVVGDRGVELSGGQCQRIAIARAVLLKPPVLMLDEATSALDNENEKRVYDSLYGLKRKRILIVVAHRLSTIRNADQIVVLQAGRIVEVGTHDALIRAEGAYAKLYSADAKGERIGVRV